MLVASLSRVDEAHAAEPWSQVEVEWSAPEGCPASGALRLLVVARVPQDAAVRARGRVEHVGELYRLELDVETASGRGERALEAPTCEALASSAAIVIAMSAAAVVAGPVRGRTHEEEVAPATPAAPPAARFLVRGQIIDDSGTLPSLGVGGGLAFGVRIAADVRVEVNANAFGAQDGRVAGTSPARGASFVLLTAGLRACWSLTRRIEVAPCLGIELDRLAGTGFGAAQNEGATALAWLPEALLTLFVPAAGPLGLRAGIGGGVPMSRQSFVITSAGSVHRPAVVAVRAWIGPEMSF